MKIKKVKRDHQSGKWAINLVFILILSNFSLQAQTILPTNTGNACAYCAPPGWSVISGSTDISNTVGWAGSTTYPWISVTNPPNGHTTWVNGFYTEIVGTTVSGLVPGNPYSFTFYSAELQSTSGGGIDPIFDGILEVYDCNTNATLGTFPYFGGANSAWQLETLTFTPVSTTQMLCFRYQNTPPTNGNFWNISFDVNVVNPTCDLTTTLAPTNVTCFGDATGVATAIGTNGTPPYTYQWNNGSNNQTINGLNAGTYVVTVTDANGCTETNQAIISQPPNLQFSITSTPSPCSGAGAATITVSGGTPGYTYNWSDGQTTGTATGLTAGVYIFTITDANQCTKVGSVNIPNGTPPSLSVTSTDVRCFGENSGTATATIVNGTPPFQYVWSNGQSLMTADLLDAGIHTVTITDAAGCIATESISISEPNEMTIVFNVANVGCDSVNDGTITAINLHGVGPISYQWSSSAGNQTTSIISGLTAGVYTVTLTDAKGCQAKAGTMVNTENCAPPCPINPCVDAILNNTDICSTLTNDPGDPLASLDCDSDGVTNEDECSDGTDPLDPCDYVDTSITLPVTADQSECPIPCPDLSPVMTILPSNIAGMSAVEVAVQITELENIDTDGSIVTLRIPSDPRFIFVWNIGLTQAAGIPVQNSDWNYLGNNGVFNVWTYNGPGLVIPAGGSTAIGFQSFYDPQSTDGQTTITATVAPLSGGECNVLNNTDSERLVYFK